MAVVHALQKPTGVSFAYFRSVFNPSGGECRGEILTAFAGPCKKPFVYRLFPPFFFTTASRLYFGRWFSDGEHPFFLATSMEEAFLILPGSRDAF